MSNEPSKYEVIIFWSQSDEAFGGDSGPGASRTRTADQAVSGKEAHRERGDGPGHWCIPVRQIGQDVGRKGMIDDAIIPFLRELSRATFFTRDEGFDRRCGTVVRVAPTGIHIWRFRDLADETFSWPS